MPSLGEFDRTEALLVMGTVRGVRSWSIVPDEKDEEAVALGGVMFPSQRWQPGENLAVHHVGSIASALVLGGRSPAAPDHPVARLHCTCGFYAYFKRNTYKVRYRNVTGIIEGYGRVTMGDLGFRASKARIVALVDPTPRWAHLAQRFGAPPLLVDEYFQQIKQRYDVPVYPTLAAARREHPTGNPL